MKKTGPLEPVLSSQPAPSAGSPVAARGGLAELLGPSRRTPTLAQALGPSTRVKILALAVLMVALHYWQIDVLFRNWMSDPNWSHGLIIPLFSLYLIYSRREDLFEAVVRTNHPELYPPQEPGRLARLAAPLRRALGPLTYLSPRRDLWGALGLGLVVLSLAGQVLALLMLHAIGIENYWPVNLLMVSMLFGLVLYLAGPKVIRVTWLPIVFLVFALPIPNSLYARVSLPLQNLSAKGAVVLLRVLGVDIFAVASRLEVASTSDPSYYHQLTVAEACSGMHLLMAFLALGVAMAYLDYKPIWQRLVLVASAIPIAVFCNVLRVAITCWMYHIDKEEMGQGFMHSFTGMLMLIPAFVLLWLLALLLKWLVPQDDEEEELSPVGPAPEDSAP